MGCALVFAMSLWGLIYKSALRNLKKQEYYFKKDNLDKNCLPPNSQSSLQSSVGANHFLWLLTHLLCSVLRGTSCQCLAFLDLRRKLLSALDGILCVGVGISKNSEWSQHYIKRTPEEQVSAQWDWELQRGSGSVKSGLLISLLEMIFFFSLNQGTLK